MNFDDTSNTWLQLDLDLGLALHDHFDDHRKRESKKKRMENPSKCIKAYPMLTLGPSKEQDEDNTKIQHSISKTESCDQNLPTQFTSPSIESSFSNSTSIKRESGEEFEVEIEKVPITRIGNVDHKDGSLRKKLRLTKEQSEVLEENFREHSTLNPKQKQALANKLNLQARQVEVWFQNRRARTKLKQTESDCEVLKKCCESLTEENKKLQKELHELKSMQTVAASPFYMKIPAATLTICPSCETICGGNNNGSLPSTTLLIGSKAHHFHKNNNNDNYQFPQPS